MVLLVLFLLWLGGKLRGYWMRQRHQQQHLVDTINELLPQTQCGRCSYEGCLPYARAIAEGEAINKCPPGGQATIAALAQLLHERPGQLDPAHGCATPAQVAVIREDECIGCTKCIRACPVDAIVGGPKLMHTVIASECNGCDLCLDPCPVDCIDLLPVSRPDSGPLPDRYATPLRKALTC
jgi:electron transport complex protein RnfB